MFATRLISLPPVSVLGGVSCTGNRAFPVQDLEISWPAGAAPEPRESSERLLDLRKESGNLSIEAREELNSWMRHAALNLEHSLWQRSHAQRATPSFSQEACGCGHQERPEPVPSSDSS